MAEPPPVLAAGARPATPGRPLSDPPSGPAAALARLAGGRDESAWAWIAEHEGPAMYRVAARMVGAAAADDACQEALLHVRNSARAFRPPTDGDSDPDAAARGWLMRIAANAAAMWARGERRRSARERHAMAEAPTEARIDGGHGAATTGELQPVAVEALRQALAELPESQRLPLMLHYFAGQDFATVGAAVGASAGTVRVRAHRGLVRLRERLTRVGVAVAGVTLLEQLGAAEVAVPAAAPAAWTTLLTTSATPVVAKTAILGGLTLMTKIAIAIAGLTIAGLLTATALPSAAEEHADKPRQEEPRKKEEPRTKKEEPREKPKVKEEGKDAMPVGTKGEIDGVILGKEGGKVLVKTEEGNLMFWPWWRGGAPKDGGGFDKEMLKKLEQFKVGDRVHIGWSFNEHRRIESIRAAGAK